MSSLFSAYRTPPWSLQRRLVVTLLVCLAVLLAWKLTDSRAFTEFTPIEMHPDGTFILR